jgi:hypothetical protein
MQWATQCCAVFFVNESAESKTNITQLRNGLYEKIHFQGEKYDINQPLINKDKILLP